MKKIWMKIVCILCLLMLTGCAKETNEFPEELMDKEWLFYDEVAAESLVLRFSSEGEFSYHCRCGEPVGDSDLYELYKYDAETEVLTLYNDYDDSTAEAKILCYNEEHLMLEIDGEIKDFNLEEFDTTSQFYCMEGEEYFSGYESFSRIIEIKDNAIVCAPHAYDSQGIYQDGPFEEYPLAKDVKWEEISITSWIVITDDMENEERYEKQYRELTDEDLITLNECGCGAAFLWFNDEMKVEKVLFWGELTIME